MTRSPITSKEQTSPKAGHVPKALPVTTLDRALSQGPQTITRNGAELAIELSMGDVLVLKAIMANLEAHLLGDPKVDEFDAPRARGAGLWVEH